VRIEVSADHIARRKRGFRCHCPVALAIAEALGFAPGNWHDARLYVLSSRVALRNENGILIRHELPLAAVDFISRFDHGLTVEPFSFELEVPDAVVG
jgi:hypothetical protein